MNKYVLFTLIYLTIQHLIYLLVEYQLIADVIEDIQKEPLDFASTIPKLLKTIIIYIIYYGSVIYLAIKYLFNSSSVLENFTFGTMLFLMVDFGILSMFNNTNKHITSFLFDMFILGGFGLASSIFIVKSYEKVLSNNFILLFLIFISSGIYLFYYSYKDTQQKLHPNYPPLYKPTQ